MHGKMCLFSVKPLGFLHDSNVSLLVGDLAGQEREVEKRSRFMLAAREDGEQIESVNISGGGDVLLVGGDVGRNF